MPSLGLQVARRLQLRRAVVGVFIGAGLLLVALALAAETDEHDGLRLTRRGEHMSELPATGTVFQAYDLIESVAASPMLLRLQSELVIELLPESAFLVLPNRRIVLLAGGLHLQPRDTGWVLEYRGLDLVIGQAELDLMADPHGGIVVSARSGRAELRETGAHERVFVSPGVAAVYHPQLGLRNKAIASGVVVSRTALHRHMSQASLLALAEEYERQRLRFLEAFAQVFGEYGVMQDLRRIEQAERDGVPLGFFSILPDGSGLSLVEVAGSEGVPPQDLEAATRRLLLEATAFDQDLRRVSATVAMQNTDHELSERLRNRAARDRERLAAAYYAARLVLVPAGG